MASFAVPVVNEETAGVDISSSKPVGILFCYLVSSSQIHKRFAEQARHDRSHKDKKSRGRLGAAKKGGAGGKFTWGAAGDEYFGGELELDPNDPNYDSGNENVRQL